MHLSRCNSMAVKGENLSIQAQTGFIDAGNVKFKYQKLKHVWYLYKLLQGSRLKWMAVTARGWGRVLGFYILCTHIEHRIIIIKQRANLIQEHSIQPDSQLFIYLSAIKPNPILPNHPLSLAIRHRHYIRVAPHSWPPKQQLVYYQYY